MMTRGLAALLLGGGLLGCAQTVPVYDVEVRDGLRAASEDTRMLMEPLPGALPVPVDAVVLMDGRTLGPGERHLQLSWEGDFAVVGSDDALFKERAPIGYVRYVVQHAVPGMVFAREYRDGHQVAITQLMSQRQMEPSLVVIGLGLGAVGGKFYLDHRDNQKVEDVHQALFGRRKKGVDFPSALVKAEVLGGVGAIVLIAGLAGTERLVLPNGLRIRPVQSAAGGATPMVAASYHW